MQNNSPTKDKARKIKSSRLLLILIALAMVSVALTLLFLWLMTKEVNTITLLKEQVIELNRQQRVIESSQTLSDRYKDEIEVIAAVFPNEETIAVFIQDLETQLKLFTDNYAFKFNSNTPLSEGERLFLTVNLTVKTDLDRLLLLLEQLETMRYMTHITSINAQTPEDFGGVAEYIIVLKVYVQKPFNSQ